MDTPIVVSLAFALDPLDPDELLPAPPPPQAASDSARTALAAVKPSFLLTLISSSRCLPPLDPVDPAQARAAASGANVSANNRLRQPLVPVWLSRSRNPGDIGSCPGSRAVPTRLS